MKINIIGAGMSGLLAANMLRRHDISIYEKNPNLPNNHHSVLRFRTQNIGDILGIQFKKVNMIKTYVPQKNIVADSISYSYKCTGEYRSDRSIIEGTVMSERYVAPPNLIQLMSSGIGIYYGTSYNFMDSRIPVISTIPMPILMDALGYDYAHNIGFNYVHGLVLSATIEKCNAYVSVLFPGSIKYRPYSRATITGNELIIEFPNTEFIHEKETLEEILSHLGLYGATISNVQIKKQQYHKILDIDDAERKKFMRWATVNHNIYSLGRYATWRPKLLLDDLIKDVKKIESWIQGGK